VLLMLLLSLSSERLPGLGMKVLSLDGL